MRFMWSTTNATKLLLENFSWNVAEKYTRVLLEKETGRVFQSTTNDLKHAISANPVIIQLKFIVYLT